MIPAEGMEEETANPPRLRALHDLATGLDREGDGLRRWLDAALDLFGADHIAACLPTDDGAPRVVHGRAPAQGPGGEGRSAISTTLVRAALADGRTASFEAGDREGPGSARALGIVTALAVPLWRGPPQWGRPAAGALYVDVRTARSVLRAWSRDDVERAAVILSTALGPARPGGEVAARPGAVDGAPALDRLLAPPSMRAVAGELEAAIAARSPVLITGASGTGKTALAMALARASGLRPVVRLTLGASDDLNTIASELFGHEKGAFTGAARRRPGLVELADGGALVLDELLNLPPHAQRLLLDLVQFGTFRPLGWSRAAPCSARVRIIACTHGDLRAALASGALRQDLYFRLSGVRVEVPPLRARRAEIAALAEAHLSATWPDRAWTLEPALAAALAAPTTAWPGNVRQLLAVTERLVARALHRAPATARLTLGDLRGGDLDDAIGAPRAATVDPPTTPTAEGLSARWDALRRQRAALDVDEARLIREALARHRGVVAHAARELGAHRTSLLSRMSTLGLDRDAAPDE